MFPLQEITKAMQEKNLSVYWAQVYGAAQASVDLNGPSGEVVLVVRGREAKKDTTHQLIRSGPKGKYLSKWGPNLILCIFLAREIIEWIEQHEVECLNDPY